MAPAPDPSGSEPAAGSEVADLSRRDPYGGPSPFRDPKLLAMALIAFGAFLMLLFGVGSTPLPTDGDGSLGFGDYDENATPEEVVPLSISTNRSPVVDEPIEFSVRDTNGTPVENATVSLSGTDRTTDRRGRTVFRPSRLGAAVVLAQKRNGTANGTPFAAATERIVVERRTVGLAVTTDETPTATRPATFTVRRTDTGRPVPARLSIDDRLYFTDSNGTVTTTFDRSRVLNVSAARPATRRIRYTDANRTAFVQRRTVPLSVATNRSTVPVNESVGVRVTRTDTGEPVSTSLSVDDPSLIDLRSDRTDANGSARFRARLPGRVTMTALKNRTDALTFTTATETVEVDRIPVNLSVNATPVEPRVGERVTVRLVREDTGEPTSGSLRLVNVTYPVDGVFGVTFQSPTTVTVDGFRPRTRYRTFRSANRTIPVVGPAFRLGSPSVDGTNRTDDGAIPTNGTVVVNTTLRNVGTAAGPGRVDLTVGDETVGFRTVTLDPNASERVEFGVPAPDAPANETRTYNLTVTVRQLRDAGPLSRADDVRSEAVAVVNLTSPNATNVTDANGSVLGGGLGSGPMDGVDDTTEGPESIADTARARSADAGG